MVIKIKSLIYALLGLIISVILCGAFLFAFGGFRFNPLEAVKTSSMINDKSLLLGETEVGSYHFFLYENENQYCTVITKRVLRFWKMFEETSTAKSDDSIRIVGGRGICDGRNVITVLFVQNFDDHIAYIEMGSGEDCIIKKVTVGETVHFIWNKDITLNSSNAVAYSDDDKPLYKLAYKNPAHTDFLRWLPAK